MAEKLSDILVVCDMDGTLLTEDMTLSSCNLQTIRLFKSLGGNIAVATGRTHASIAVYPQLLEFIEPAVCYGGAVIYDFAQNKPVNVQYLPMPAAWQVLRDVQQHFPQAGVMVYGSDLRLYQTVGSDYLYNLTTDEDMLYFSRPAEDIPEMWIKLLFTGPPELLREVEAFVHRNSYPGLYFIATSPQYFEVMPKGASKGSAVHKLCGMLGIPLRNLIVIGDYYNDIDMMKRAGCSVAMGNAPDDVKRVANELTDRCENAGVAQYLYKLIQKYE